MKKSYNSNYFGARSVQKAHPKCNVPDLATYLFYLLFIDDITILMISLYIYLVNYHICLYKNSQSHKLNILAIMGNHI